jgi:hypothetical protein
MDTNATGGMFPAWKLPEDLQTEELGSLAITDQERFEKVVRLIRTVRDDDMLLSLLTVAGVLVATLDFPWTDKLRPIIPRLSSLIRTGTEPALVKAALTCLGNMIISDKEACEQAL